MDKLQFVLMVSTPWELSWRIKKRYVLIITARRRSLGQGNMFTGVCLSTGVGCLVLGGAWSGGLGSGAGGVPGLGARPTTKGQIEGDQVQAHTQGGN